MSHNAVVNPTTIMSEYYLSKLKKTGRDWANTMLPACVPSKGCVYGYDSTMGDVYMPMTWREKTTLPAYREMEYVPNPHLNSTDDPEESVHINCLRMLWQMEKANLWPKWRSHHWTNEISSPLDLERYQDYGSSGSDYMYREMAVIANTLEVLYNIHLRREWIHSGSISLMQIWRQMIYSEYISKWPWESSPKCMTWEMLKKTQTCISEKSTCLNTMDVSTWCAWASHTLQQVQDTYQAHNQES